jgi:hypothetical protein
VKTENNWKLRQALLRQGNHTLQEGFLNWHEKSSTCPVYGEAITETSFHGSIVKGDCNPSKDEVVKGRMCVPSNASPVGLSLTENSGSRDTVTESLYSLNSSCSRIDVIQHGGNPQEYLSTSYEANGRCPALSHIMRKEVLEVMISGLKRCESLHKAQCLISRKYSFSSPNFMQPNTFAMTAYLYAFSV